MFLYCKIIKYIMIFYYVIQYEKDNHMIFCGMNFDKKVKALILWLMKHVSIH